MGVQQAFLHNPLRERMRENRLVEINNKKNNHLKKGKEATDSRGRKERPLV